MATSLLRFLTLRMPSIAAMSFVAMAVPCLILLKYEVRLAALSSSGEDAVDTASTLEGKASRSPALAYGNQSLLPFEAAFGGTIIWGVLGLAPALRGFDRGMRWAAARISQTLVLQAACLPVAAYYGILTLTSRFSPEGKVRCTS